MADSNFSSSGGTDWLCAGISWFEFFRCGGGRCLWLITSGRVVLIAYIGQADTHCSLEEYRGMIGSHDGK